MSSSNKDVYDVERIVGKRLNKKGRPEYFVKWKGYASTQNTWEPESHLANCRDLIEAFTDEQPKTKKSDKKVSPRRASRKSTSGAHTKVRQRNIKKKTSSHRKRPSTIKVKSETSTRSSSSSAVVNRRKRPSTNDENESGLKSSSNKRSRKSTSNTSGSINDNSHVIDDAVKLDRILDVRRNKKANTIEYQVQMKKVQKPMWAPIDRLSGSYAQEIIHFLHEKYV